MTSAITLIHQPKTCLITGRHRLTFQGSLSQRLALTHPASYGKGKYISYGIRDKLKGIFAGFSYDIIRNVKGAFSYSYSKTTSNDITREYEKTWSQPALR